MSELRKRAPRTAGQRQNRESHIDQGLIGRGLYLQAEEPSRLHAGQLQPIEEITASEDESAQRRNFEQKEENAIREPYKPVQRGSRCGVMPVWFSWNPS